MNLIFITRLDHQDGVIAAAETDFRNSESGFADRSIVHNDTSLTPKRMKAKI
jgi:hypothetical protein